MTTQTDRELLELAAKAIGHESHWNLAPAHQLFKDGKYVCFWNPLTDDGDALRLAVKLEIVVIPPIVSMGYGQATAKIIKTQKQVVEWGDKRDPYAATRRAIVRAAAEIGKAMQ